LTDPDQNLSSMSEDQILELIKLFEGFTQASSSFAKSYNALEQRIAQLSSQLEEQSRLLERTEGFLSSVLAHVPVGIVVLDLDGRISLFNEEAERLTHFKAVDVVSQPYGDVFPVDVNEPDSALFTLTNGTIIDSHEKILRTEEGHEMPIRFSTSWIHGDDGKPMGVLEVIEDLRPIRDLQQRMQQSANLASLGEMAAQVAHELRNPLAGVQGFAQFLMEDLDEEHPARPIANKIISGVKDINQIASRLLEFTRPMAPSFSSVDLIKLLSQEVELIMSEVDQNENCEIEFDEKFPTERIQVECDPVLMKQVFLNVLKNSIQFLPDGGKVIVKLKWDLLRNRVRITFIDSGPGIKQENLQKIFNPFFTTRTKGTGLGLSMVKKILDAHHGSVFVSSEEEEGATFVIELPILRNK